MEDIDRYGDRRERYIVHILYVIAKPHTILMVPFVKEFTSD